MVLSGQVQGEMMIRLSQEAYKVPSSEVSRVSKLAVGGEDIENLGLWDQRHIEFGYKSGLM